MSFESQVEYWEQAFMDGPAKIRAMTEKYVKQDEELTALHTVAAKLAEAATRARRSLSWGEAQTRLTPSERQYFTDDLANIDAALAEYQRVTALQPKEQ